jgi:DNA-binding CsgD family transcriptional regulator
MKIEIDQLEKDKIDLELKHKNQEIANLIISVARKNETLFALKENIRSVAVNLSKTNTVESKRELLLINNSIESSMEGDELLKRFEEQFDLVNNNFMKRLSQKHPDLSANERLMCAYLKMNLSTKEMAPLLNISVRGVETMRYRIRKKFDLGRETNLIDYINSFA